MSVILHLEVAGLDLLQPVEDRRVQAARTLERERRLLRADERRDEHGIHRFECGGNGGCLPLPDRGQRRPRHRRVEGADHVGLGLAVAQQQQSHQSESTFLFAR